MDRLKCNACSGLVWFVNSHARPRFLGKKNICFVFYYLEKAFEKVPRRWFGRQCEGSKSMNGLLQVVKKM